MENPQPQQLSEQQHMGQQQTEQQGSQQQQQQWGDALLQRISQMEAALNQERQQREILTRQLQARESAATTEQAIPADNQTQEERKPGKTIDLGEYSGGWKGLELWLQTATAKLAVDFVGCKEKAKFWYLVGKLRGDAAEKVTPWIRQHSNYDYVNSEDLLTKLREIFGDRYERENALVRLNQLRQGTGKPFRAHLQEFEKLLLEAGRYADSDASKKASLEATISKELYERTISMGTRRMTYNEYKESLLEVSEKIQQSRKPWTTYRGYQQQREASAVQESSDVMDWEPSTARVSMGNGKRARWVATAEIQKRRDQGLCVRCGGSGHFVSRCPFLPARRPDNQPPRPKSESNVAVAVAPLLEENEQEERTGKRVALAENRKQGLNSETVKAEWRLFEKKMAKPSLLVPVIVDNICPARSLVDSGCEAYGLIDQRFALRCKLERIPIAPRAMKSVKGELDETWQLTEVARMEMDMGGHRQKLFCYVVPRLEGYEMILGYPWMQFEKADLLASENQLLFRNTGLVVKQEKDLPRTNHRLVSAAAFNLLRKSRKHGKVQVFAASMADINKALREKKRTDPRTKLPDWIDQNKYLKLFDYEEGSRLPPHRSGVDHKIELEKDKDGKIPEAPWGPLYNMSRDELLVLRKTLNDLLDKGFIRVSSSPAAAPVLFAKKPGGGLRFCCDYRALNRLTRKDRYPLPLIQETLSRISKASWFTKLDVMAAFHKIRIAEGDEWMTAFRTRFGLFEWLVTPFGLANAPSTFQRYINWILREYLDEFVSAYVDDILIFTEGSRRLHRQQVQKVLDRLSEAGLHLDIDKCEFETKTTKYLGFIIAEGQIRMDPQKVKAISDWQSPETVKGVQAFLGFANFYRRFIKDFSNIAAPLTRLSKKDVEFRWDRSAEEAFSKLKRLFTSAPVLAQFNFERETVLETDASGYCTGGILSQYDDEGLLRPCAYFSKRNQPAECNYQIHDKELLAIIKCLREWDAELRSVKKFSIITDHKNLEYFTTTRKLTERQVRWSEELSRYNFEIIYRPGKKGIQPDALTRREQDLPTSIEDDRLKYRMGQLLQQNGDVLTVASISTFEDEIMPVRDQNSGELKDTAQEVEKLWEIALDQDKDYLRLKDSVKQDSRVFPRDLHRQVKVSIADCGLDEQDRLTYRGRLWVPDHEPLRTRIVQELHDSSLTSHPGREGTMALVGRQYFWPNYVEDVRRLIRNCDTCGRSKNWRDRRQGLLRPLPVPERQWREISMDFIGPLPMSQSCDMLMVITDRLSKGVILEACPNTETETVARIFLQSYYRRHGLPSAIVSDRGPQFVSRFWKRFCQQLGIQRRISTAYHPETDGATERMNAEIEVILRQVVGHDQDDWVEHLPVVELALNGRNSTSTGMSSFFLTHGYHLEPLQLFETKDTTSAKTPIQKADSVAAKLKQATEWAQSAMANAQQEQERQANRHRTAHPAYKIGDKVWLSLRNISTDRPSKKLDDKAAKYTVTEVVGAQSYRLDIPSVHNVFNADLLRPAATDPLPSQSQSDYQPPPIVFDGEDYYDVEAILSERTRRRQKQYKVKWKGYARPTWEPAFAVKETDALKAYLTSKSRLGGGG